MKFRIRVNPIKCDARGLCAELFPERIKLDDWGYPIVSDKPFSDSSLPEAELAARECPLLAILIDPVAEES